MVRSLDLDSLLQPLFCQTFASLNTGQVLVSSSPPRVCPRPHSLDAAWRFSLPVPCAARGTSPSFDTAVKSCRLRNRRPVSRVIFQDFNTNVGTIATVAVDGSMRYVTFVPIKC